MKKILIVASTLSFVACATAYKDAVKSEYIGNGIYEIRSAGNSDTSEDDIRGYLYRKAYETCAAKEMGFHLSGATESTTKSQTVAISNGFGGFNLVNSTEPGARMLIRCEGPVDPELVAKYK